MNLEKYILTWHKYTDHLRGMLFNMLSSKELTDVTLVSEDKKQFRAHKVVLSACSSVLKSYISKSTTLSPVIHLRGVKSNEIESILQFIYLGEAAFDLYRIKDFLNVARRLDIKGIDYDLKIPDTVHFVDVSKQKWDQTNKLRIEAKEIRESSNRNRRHVRSKQDKRYPCKQCNYISKLRNNLDQHVKSIHKGVVYPCDQCNLISSNPNNLRQHKKSVHEKVKYLCDKCSFKATRPGYLRKHIKEVH